MKIAGWLLVALGVVFALLSIDVINGNPDLAAPGSPLVMGDVPFGWRIVLGPLVFLSALSLTIGVLMALGFPRSSYLALLAFVILAVAYLLGPALVPTFTAAVIALVALLFVVPLVIVGAAFAIGRSAPRQG